MLHNYLSLPVTQLMNPRSQVKGKPSYFERLLWPECQRLWPECQRGDFIITIVDWYDAVFLARSPIVFLPCLFSTTRGKRWKEPFVLAMWHTKESKFEFWSLCIFLKSAALSFNYDWLYWIEKNVLLLYEVFFFLKSLVNHVRIRFLD